MRHRHWLTINVINLCRPHDDQGEEIAAAQEGDEEDDNHCVLRLAEHCARYHGGVRVKLPYEEGDDHYRSKYERNEVVHTTPFVLRNISIIPDQNAAFLH